MVFEGLIGKTGKNGRKSRLSPAQKVDTFEKSVVMKCKSCVGVVW